MKSLGIELGGVPKLALSLMDLSDLTVAAKVAVGDDAQGIWLEHARTDALSARGAWQKKAALERGAFLLSTNLGNVGVVLGGDGPAFNLFADESWLEKKLSELGLSPLSPARTSR